MQLITAANQIIKLFKYPGTAAILMAKVGKADQV